MTKNFRSAILLVVILGVVVSAGVWVANPVVWAGPAEKQVYRSDEELLKGIIVASNDVSRAYQILWWIDPMIQCQVIQGGDYAPPPALEEVENLLTEGLNGIADIEGESRFLNQYRDVLLKNIPKMIVALKMKKDAISAFAREEKVPDNIFAKAQTRFEMHANEIFDYEAQTAAPKIKESYPDFYGSFSSDFRRAGDGIAIEIDPNVSMGFQTWDVGNKIVVGFVCCGSNAEKAGIRAGDEIISLKGGEPFKDKTAYLKSELIRTAKPGVKIGLVIKRNGELKTVEFDAQDRRAYEMDLRNQYAVARKKGRAARGLLNL